MNTAAMHSHSQPQEHPPVLPPLAELLDMARVVSLPTRTSFRGVTQREAVVFDAPCGATEFSPFIEYEAVEAAAWLAAALEFGWSTAPATVRHSIDINATVPAVAADEVAGVLARFDGCRTAKVKVAERGQSLADDIARVRATRELMGAEAHIRIDANAGWSLEEATTALLALAPFRLEYAEQPCATVAELAELRARLHERSPGAAVRIAADESVRKASDPLAVARSGAADLLIIKAQPLGGTKRALEIVTEAGLPVVVSSALDTSVGIAMGLHLAAALPDGLLAGACGLGTVALLAGDVTTHSLVPVDGAISVQRPVLDQSKLTQFAASADRTAWWHERIAACYQLLNRPES